MIPTNSLIRVQKEEVDLNELSNQVQKDLEQKNSGAGALEVRRVENGRPQGGQGPQAKGPLRPFFYAILFILIYISGTFRIEMGHEHRRWPRA